MSHRDDIPLSEEEKALAREGEALIRAEVERVRAPQSLRERIEVDRARGGRQTRAPFWRRRRAAIFATAAAVAVVTVVALQAGGGGGEPSLGGVEAAAALSPTQAAPASLGGSPPVLDVAVGAIDFPDWQGRFGLRAVGQRRDEVSGRAVTTVFYRSPDGTRLGYAIVGGPPLRARPGGTAVVHDGKTYHVAAAGSHNLVTWTQQGHTCVIVASAGVPSAKLVELAASRNV